MSGRGPRQGPRQGRRREEARRGREATGPVDRRIKHHVCLDCQKRGYASLDLARRALSSVAAQGGLYSRNRYAYKPYLCPHGWYHIGRSPATVKLIEEKLREKTGQAKAAKARAA